MVRPAGRLPRSLLIATKHRADIQTLRAIAVAAVVFFHLRPEWFPGGFVGVDVFFVISGFLITSSLAAEAISTGTVRLSKFWGRRIRRLMPAATVVLIAVGAAAIVLLPLSQRITIMVQTLASAVSVQNWTLAAESVTYLQSTELPSPLQHFWSLSVEEQFYIAWPLLIVGLLLIAGRGSLSRTTLLRTLVTVLAVASLVYSIIASVVTPSLAYFSTFTRAWELLLGAALALWLPALGTHRVLSRIAVLAGLGAIALSIWLIDSDTVFPGYAALLPTLGTAAVIWGGIGAGEWMPGRIMAWRPITWLGDISYSLYLWHWPAIIVLTTTLGVAQLPIWAVAAVLVGSVLVAWLSKRYVEDFFQRPREPQQAPSPAARARRSPFALGVALLAVTSLVTGVMYADLQRVIRALDEQQQITAANSPGARLLDPDFDLSTFPDLPTRPTPDIITLQTKVERQLDVGCLAEEDAVEVTSCEAGDPDGDRTILLVGDSHAAHWLPAVDELGNKFGWRVVLAGERGCPFATMPGDYHANALITSQCIAWNENVRDLITSERPDLVITSISTYRYPDEADNDALRQRVDAGVAESMARQYAFVADLGIPLVTIKETSQFPGFSAAECFAHSENTVADCSAQLNAARTLGVSRVALAHAIEPRAIPIDFTDLICPETTCYAAIGNVVSYRDDNHFTDPYARSLGWALIDKLEAALPQLFPTKP